jgi:hypothetical protein
LAHCCLQKKYGYKYLQVTDPLPVMKNILTNLGFFPANRLDLFGDVNNLLSNFHLQLWLFISLAFFQGN